MIFDTDVLMYISKLFIFLIQKMDIMGSAPRLPVT